MGFQKVLVLDFNAQNSFFDINTFNLSLKLLLEEPEFFRQIVLLCMLYLLYQASDEVEAGYIFDFDWDNFLLGSLVDHVVNIQWNLYGIFTARRLLSTPVMLALKFVEFENYMLEDVLAEKFVLVFTRLV